MIDEDLYKIASDELNSDARKPNVWARACALASDDHDEARFLYTNLRVEEMLNKDGKQRTFSTGNEQRSAEFSQSESENVSGSTNVGSENTGPEDVANGSPDALGSPDLGLDNNTAAIESSRAGVGSDKSPLPTDELDSFGVDNIGAPSSAPGTDALADKVIEFDDETMAEFAALSVENGNESSTLSSLTGEPGISSQTQADAANSGEYVSNVFGATAPPNREKMASQGKNQAMSGGQMLTDENAPSPTNDQALSAANEFEHDVQPNSVDLDATTETAHADSAYAADGDTVSRRAHSLDDTETSYDDHNTHDITSELDTGVGRSFMVFNRNGALRTVKQGLSWPALLFTFPWLLSKAMFGTAIAYGLLWLVSLGGLLVTATHWMNVGATASLDIKLWTGAFALLTIIGLFYIPFRYGNRWLAGKLQNRGFDYEGSVSADNKLEAVARLVINRKDSAL